MALTLLEKLRTIVPKINDEAHELLQKYGDVKISEVSVKQAYGGMRGVKAQVCDTSVVNDDQGLIIRGRPILTLKDRLPEEIFWLLLTGELPTPEEVKGLQKQLNQAKEVPAYIWKILKAMPKNSHPMTMLNAAVLAMGNDSHFRRRYEDGMPKGEYWEAALTDAIKIMATIHTIAAGIYRIRYKKGAVILPSGRNDWGAEYARMLGLPPKKGLLAKMMRMYLTLHSDHEGGNVSAYTCHVVGSALSDPFYAVSAGLNGLAGPLHGLANQECLKWILMVMEHFGGVPTEKEIRDFAWQTLKGGHVIPGYGHAVLRVTDPRFTAFHEFAEQHFPDDAVFKTVDLVFNVVPKVLLEQGKAKDPWPNVDAGSGAILYYFGLKEFEYYTVLFSVSRCMGMLAQTIISRAMNEPITRPKSISTEWIKKTVATPK
jgi:citrate synthase